MTIARFRVFLIASAILSIAAVATVFLPDGYSPALAEAYANEPLPWLFEREGVAIGVGIAAQLKIDVPVIVKSANDLATIIDDNTLADAATDPSRLLVAFVQEADALPALSAIAPHVVPPEQFLLGSEAAYLHCARGILESKAGEALVGKAGKAATTRNWATVLKLQALVDKIDA